MPSSHLILCRPLLLLPPIHPSIRVFSNEPTLRMRWPKYWSFSFSISPSSKYSGLISFRMGWLDLLAVQETRKNLLQHHSSKASVLGHSDFFIIQLSPPYMTTGETIALIIWTFVGKVMSLCYSFPSSSEKLKMPINKEPQNPGANKPFLNVIQALTNLYMEISAVMLEIWACMFSHKKSFSLIIQWLKVQLLTSDMPVGSFNPLGPCSSPQQN